MTWPLKSKRSLQRRRKMGVKTHRKPCVSFYHFHPHHLLPPTPSLPTLSLPSLRGFSWRTWDLVLSLCSCLSKRSKYTKKYSLKSAAAAHLKHIIASAWFTSFCALNENTGTNLYLLTQFLTCFVKVGVKL